MAAARSPTRAGHGHDDHHQEESVVRSVEAVPPRDQGGGDGDRSDDGRRHDQPVGLEHGSRVLLGVPVTPMALVGATGRVWSLCPHIHCHTPGMKL